MGLRRRRRRRRGLACSASSTGAGGCSLGAVSTAEVELVSPAAVVRVEAFRAGCRFAAAVAAVFPPGSAFGFAVRADGRRGFRVVPAAVSVSVSASGSPSSGFAASSAGFRAVLPDRLRRRRRAGGAGEGVSVSSAAGSVAASGSPVTAGASELTGADRDVELALLRPRPPRRRRRGRPVAGVSAATLSVAGTDGSSVISESFLLGATRSRPEGPHARGGPRSGYAWVLVLTAGISSRRSRTEHLFASDSAPRARGRVLGTKTSTIRIAGGRTFSSAAAT